MEKETQPCIPCETTEEQTYNDSELWLLWLDKRLNGLTWDAIGQANGVTRQAAQSMVTRWLKKLAKAAKELRTRAANATVVESTLEGSSLCNAPEQLATLNHGHWLIFQYDKPNDLAQLRKLAAGKNAKLRLLPNNHVLVFRQ